MKTWSSHIRARQLFNPFFFGILITIFIFRPPLAAQAQGDESVLEQKVRLDLKRANVYQALNALSDSTDLLFAYDSNLINNERRVRVKFENVTIRDALGSILNDTTLTYRVIDRHVLIHKAEEEDKPEPQLALNYLTARGRVLDSETKQPLVYATVGIPELAMGIITNSDGYFTLKIPRDIGAHSLNISHIGYKVKRIPVEIFEHNSVDIFLQVDFVSIQEVIIRNINPELLVKEAIVKIPENYSTVPFYSNSFYREGVIKSKRFQSYSEAIFKIFNSSYLPNQESNQVKLLKSRNSQNIDQADTLSIKLRGGVGSSLTLDIVRTFPEFLQYDFWEYYRFFKKDIVSIDDRTAYSIGFEQNEKMSEPLLEGTMYIDTETSAILGADFEVNPQHISKITAQFVYKKNNKFRFRPKRIAYSVRYGKIGSRYYLKHVRGDLQFKYKYRRSVSSNTFHLFFELVTTRVETENVTRFNKKEVIRTQNIFQENSFIYDEFFWMDQNVIAPERSVTESLKEINAKIEETLFD